LRKSFFNPYGVWALVAGGLQLAWGFPASAESSAESNTFSIQVPNANTWVPYVMGALVLILLVVIFVLWKKRQSPSQGAAPSGSPRVNSKETMGGSSASSSSSKNFLIDGKYRLIREIGRGGMGIVYEAENVKLGRKVALKKMREELKLNPRDRKKFLEEARNTAALEHPNIVNILDVIEEGDESYLVLEYVDGLSLKDWLDEKGKMSIKDVLKFLGGVLSALDYAHEKGILHRDLKPANILVDKGGRALIADFGVARRIKDMVSRTTGQQETSGTLAYMAPEQHVGKAEARSDIFSFGAMVYECLAGEEPFQGPDFKAQKMEKVYDTLSDKGVKVPAKMEAFIAKCLEPYPDNRYKTAGKALDAWKEIEE